MKSFTRSVMSILFVLFGCIGVFSHADESVDEMNESDSKIISHEGVDTDTKSTLGRNVDELLVTDIKIGSGRPARPKDMVTAEYKLWLYDPCASENKGKLLESSEKVGRPFYFILRGGRLPQWMGKAILGIKKGGIRQFVVPYAQVVEVFGKKESLPEGNAMVMNFEATEVRNL